MTLQEFINLPRKQRDAALQTLRNHRIGVAGLIKDLSSFTSKSADEIHIAKVAVGDARREAEEMRRTADKIIEDALAKVAQLESDAVTVPDRIKTLRQDLAQTENLLSALNDPSVQRYIALRDQLVSSDRTRG